MKNALLIISMIMLCSCNQALFDDQQGALTPSASTICSGTTILNVVGTANCSASGSSSIQIQMLSFASRKDNGSFPVTAMEFATFFAAPDRVAASLLEEAEENSIFTNNHSVIPSPLDDSDGRYGMLLTAQDLIDTGRANDIPEKKHYLETIAAAKMENDNPGSFTSRQGALSVCGASGTIDSRISDCSTANGFWSFYDGKKYGQDGEGDWKLVSVLDNAGTKYEVWRDERTKLLWSDQSSVGYNWFQAAGYSKDATLSTAESGSDASPGGPYQPLNPISVCPDVTLSGAIAAGGGTATFTYVNPETDFKAGLSYPQVTWRLPSKSDWGLAEVNGIRKVLPNIDSAFWSASTRSSNRPHAVNFYGQYGMFDTDHRSSTPPVRCVASTHD